MECKGLSTSAGLEAGVFPEPKQVKLRLETKMNNSSINKVIDEFSHLPPEDKEYVAEIIRKQLIEAKRDRLAQRAQEARLNFERGSVKAGSLKDLMEDLDSD
jgi:hypothetical protein